MFNLILQIALYMLIMCTSIPIGLLLVWLCKEELVDGRKWFRLISCIVIALIVIGILVMIFNYKEIILVSVLSLIYFEIIVLISLMKAKK